MMTVWFCAACLAATSNARSCAVSFARFREGHDDLATKTRKACKRAGLTPLKFHDLRASFATLAAGQGLPVTLLQALLSPSDVKTTAIYLRADSATAALDPQAIIGAHEAN
jgi:integrase